MSLWSATAPADVSEAAFQRAVIDYAKRNRWRVAHFHQTRREVVRRNGARLWIGDRDAAGFPDLVCVRERVVYIELKGPKTRVTPAQVDWMTALVDAGEEVYLFRPVDWPEIERVLGRRTTQ